MYTSVGTLSLDDVTASSADLADINCKYESFIRSRLIRMRRSVVHFDCSVKAASDQDVLLFIIVQSSSILGVCFEAGHNLRHMQQHRGLSRWTQPASPQDTAQHLEAALPA